jgi:predicted nucleic acid-binding protein
VRPPPGILVVDTAILIAALLGRSSTVLGLVAQRAILVTSDRAVEKARRRIELGLRRPDLLPALEGLVETIEIFAAEQLSSVESAAAALRDSVPTRNAAATDAHILALAWDADADIWSHDRDFAGTGVASWSTINLVRALAGADA